MRIIMCLFFVTTQLTLFSSSSHIQIIDNRCSVWDWDCLRRITQTEASTLARTGTPDSPKYDPLLIPYISYKRDDLATTIEGAEIRGISQAVYTKVRLDKNTNELYKRYYIPCLTVNGTYNSTGSIYSIPFEGIGDMFLRFDNVEIDAIYDYDLKRDDNGKKYAILKDVHYSFEVLDGGLFLFDNLAHGDNIKSAALHDFMHRNWKVLVPNYGKIFLDKLNEAVFKTLKSFLLVQDLDKYFYDYK